MPRLQDTCTRTHCKHNGDTLDIKRKYRLLKVCYVPTTSTTFLALYFSFFAAATISTNETNKAGNMCIIVSIFLRCPWAPYAVPKPKSKQTAFP